ncbi:MAG: purine-nucleoside phosphorylase [Ignavibacteria bacterium]
MKNKIGIILGSGLNRFSAELTNQKIISQDNESFHKLKVITGNIGDNEILLFSGRRHLYEGNLIDKVIENISTAKKWNVNFLIITNAAGGINPNFNISDLMLITSHINITNKFIIGRSCSSMLYDTILLGKVKDIVRKEKIKLRYGKYCCFPGPMYETKSEIRYLSKIGIDAVGMSTVPEILYANSLGIKCIAISCITNLISENSESITNHEEVVDAGNNAYVNFSVILKKIISKSSELIN